MEKKTVGYIPVDSGQVMLVDPCYVLDEEKYRLACDATLSDDKMGEILVKDVAGTAFVTSTATGDGMYKVEAEYNDHNEIKRIILTFDTWND